MPKDLSQAFLRECFHYQPSTGELIRKERPLVHFRNEKCQRNYNRRFAGEIAGIPRKDGYKRVSLGMSLYLSHRIVWIMHYGEIPEGYFIDHISHDRSDNKVINLRLVTQGENNKNRSVSTKNTSGIVGVNFRKDTGKWQAYIDLNGKRMGLGSFPSKIEAAAVRKAAEIKYGFHENHGKC